jgi:hypothetical protein
MSSGLFASFPVWGGTGGYAGLILPLLLVVLAGIGLRGPEAWLRRGLLSAAFVFYLLALGPRLLGVDGEASDLPGPFVALYGWTDVLRRYWWPYRHIAVLSLALVPLAGFGAQAVLARAGRLTPLVGLGMVALLPGELALRGGTTTAAASWWEAPLAYQQLADLPGEALIELPLAPAISGSQQALSYQWAHGKRLVNGHAMWVDRVRPPAWDAWVEGNSLLVGLRRAELGELDGVLEVDPADVAALQELGVRHIVLNSEYYPGALAQLLPVHNHVLVSLFGEPVLTWKNVLTVWDLDRYTGETAVVVQRFVPPDDYLAVDGSILPRNATTSSMGWRPFPRGGEIPQSSNERIQAEEAAMPEMLRRRLDREKRRERTRQRAETPAAECGEEGSECPGE